jgi:hypothetical protein
MIRRIGRYCLLVRTDYAETRIDMRRLFLVSPPKRILIVMGLIPFNNKPLNYFGSCHRETDRISSSIIRKILAETAKGYGCRMGVPER